MTLFSVFWLTTIFYCFTRKSIREMTLITLIYMTFQCTNVIQFGEVGIGPQVLTSLVYIAKYVVDSKGHIKLMKKKEFYILDVLLLVLLLDIIVSSVVNGTILNVAFKILQLLSYIMCYWCMRRALCQMSDEEIYHLVKKVIVFVVTVGLLQWVVTMVLPFLRPLLKIIFFNENSTNIYFNYTDVNHNKRIYAMFMEPSYLACFLVGGFYYLLSFREKWKKNIGLMILILFEIIFTTSSTAYGAFAIVGLLFILQSKQIPRVWRVMIFCLGIISILILYFGFYGLLDAVLFSKASTGSGITRARWNREAYLAYQSSPIFGVGYKNVRGSSIYYSLLGELGIIGVITYISFLLVSVYKVVFKNKIVITSNTGYFGAIYAVIAAAICQFIACPDLDMCSLWLMLYILAIYEGKYMQHLKENRKVNKDGK